MASFVTVGGSQARRSPESGPLDFVGRIVHLQHNQARTPNLPSFKRI
jgi:hypothetical protein